MKILVVGGGTAGFIASIILKKRFDRNITIDVVKSDKIGTIGVGEGSTEHWYEFMEFCNIPFTQLMLKCEATFKAGIYFKNWGNKNYFHNVTHYNDQKFGQNRIHYEKLILDNKPLHSKFTSNSEIPVEYIQRNGVNVNNNLPANQFHFNSLKLIKYLHEYTEMIGNNVYTDDIKDVILNEKGEIDKLKGEKQEYDYDFYIDCTGFNKLLISKLGAKWNSYSEYLTMNSAIVFPTDSEENYKMYTTAEAMNNGWRFEIPVQSRRGNGYIFNDNYTTPDIAKKEIEELFGHEIDVKKVLSFDPGAVDKFWIKNCVAMGLSGSFVEPLEATSIGTTIQQSFLLMHYLINYNDKNIEKYNNSINNVMQNIRDFVQLHYITDREDTLFWKEIKDIKITDSLKEKLELWNERLPISEDFNKDSDYVLFKDPNFIQVLYGLNMIDTDKLKIMHEYHPKQVQLNLKSLLDNVEREEKTTDTISHRKFVEIFSL